MDQNGEKISELLMKAMLDELSEDDRKELDTWLSVSEVHRQRWAEFQANGSVGRELAGLNAIDASEAYNRFRNEQRRGMLWRCCRYAAILLPFGVLLGWCIQSAFHPEVKEIPGQMEVAQIIPGTVKAELFLEDGTKYDLGEEEYKMQLKESQVNVAISNGKLQYAKTGNAGQAAKIKYNTLVIPRGGEYTLTLSDGTCVHLNASSKLKYPEQFTGMQREVFLQGEAFFEVTKQAGTVFLVHTQRGTVKVLGTSFNVRAYQDEAVEATTLVTGKVEVNVPGYQEVQMEPGEQCRLDGQGGITKQEVDVYSYIAWKEGIFAFSNEPLEEVMRTLERWYNVDTQFTQEQMRKIPVTGKIKRFSDFSQVLELLGAMGIKLEMNGNTLIVK